VTSPEIKFIEKLQKNLKLIKALAESWENTVKMAEELSRRLGMPVYFNGNPGVWPALVISPERLKDGKKILALLDKSPWETKVIFDE